MLGHNPYYWGLIRKTIVAFGALFSDIQIERRKDDSVTGTVIQTLNVPLAYGPKEKWIVRLEQDPTLQNNTYTSLPRMGFEITDYSYDSSRKTNKNQKITCGSGTSTQSYMYSPVPYNIGITLYILTKTQEDALQIIEQILPVFSPEYTLSINAVPDMNIVQNVPVILNNISATDEYDGAFTERRFVTHTLNFTLKINLFGPESVAKVITKSMANISQDSAMTQEIANYTATGNTTTGEITESWIEHF